MSDNQSAQGLDQTQSVPPLEPAPALPHGIPAIIRLENGFPELNPKLIEAIEEKPEPERRQLETRVLAERQLKIAREEFSKEKFHGDEA